MEHQTLVRIPDLILIINSKKLSRSGIYRYIRLRIESERRRKLTKYLNLTRKLKKLRNEKMTEIPTEV